MLDVPWWLLGVSSVCLPVIVIALVRYTIYSWTPKVIFTIYFMNIHLPSWLNWCKPATVNKEPKNHCLPRKAMVLFDVGIIFLLRQLREEFSPIGGGYPEGQGSKLWTLDIKWYTHFVYATLDCLRRQCNQFPTEKSNLWRSNKYLSRCLIHPRSAP